MRESTEVVVAALALALTASCANADMEQRITELEHRIAELEKANQPSKPKPALDSEKVDDEADNRRHDRDPHEAAKREHDQAMLRWGLGHMEWNEPSTCDRRPVPKAEFEALPRNARKEVPPQCVVTKTDQAVFEARERLERADAAGRRGQIVPLLEAYIHLTGTDEWSKRCEPLIDEAFRLYKTRKQDFPLGMSLRERKKLTMKAQCGTRFCLVVIGGLRPGEPSPIDLHNVVDNVARKGGNSAHLFAGARGFAADHGRAALVFKRRHVSAPGLDEMHAELVKAGELPRP